jgi:hypothetical protein
MAGENISIDASSPFFALLIFVILPLSCAMVEFTSVCEAA